MQAPPPVLPQERHLRDIGQRRRGRHQRAGDPLQLWETEAQGRQALVLIWFAIDVSSCACIWINRSSKLLLPLLLELLPLELLPELLLDASELLEAGVVMVTVEPSA